MEGAPSPPSSAPQPKRKRSPLVQWPLYLITRAWLGLLGALPLPLARKVSIALGRVVLFLVPRLHRIASEQIDAAFGDSLGREEKRRILLEAMDNLSILAAEFPHGPRLAKQRFAGLLEVRGLEHVNLNESALFISGHLANWEWMGPAWWLEGIRGVAVVRALDFPPLERYVKRMRDAVNFRTMLRDDAGARLFQLLKEGVSTGILIDQAPRENAVPCTFFGRPCWGTIGPAMIAARAKVKVHFMGMRRLPDGRYVMEVSEALPLVRTGRLLDDLTANTQICQDVLEEFIRRNPGQWLWFHRRWKERPRLAREWEARQQRAAKGSLPREE